MMTGSYSSSLEISEISIDDYQHRCSDQSQRWNTVYIQCDGILCINLADVHRAGCNDVPFISRYPTSSSWTPIVMNLRSH